MFLRVIPSHQQRHQRLKSWHHQPKSLSPSNHQPMQSTKKPHQGIHHILHQLPNAPMNPKQPTTSRARSPCSHARRLGQVCVGGWVVKTEKRGVHVTSACLTSICLLVTANALVYVPVCLYGGCFVTALLLFTETEIWQRDPRNCPFTIRRIWFDQPSSYPADFQLDHRDDGWAGSRVNSGVRMCNWLNWIQFANSF